MFEFQSPYTILLLEFLIDIIIIIVGVISGLALLDKLIELVLRSIDYIQNFFNERKVIRLKKLLAPYVYPKAELIIMRFFLNNKKEGIEDISAANISKKTQIPLVRVEKALKLLRQNDVFIQGNSRNWYIDPSVEEKCLKLYSELKINTQKES